MVMEALASMTVHNYYRKRGVVMEINRCDIYYASLNRGVGSEQRGWRPVLIIQNDKGNQHSATVIVAAITSRMTKKVLPTHVFLSRKKSGLPTDSIILMEQLHTIDKSRLYMFVCHLDHTLSSAIDRALICSLGIDNGQGEEYGHVF